MGCYVHNICYLKWVSFSMSKLSVKSCWNIQSHTERYPRGANSPSSDFFYLLVFVRFCCFFSTHRNHQGKRDEKARVLADHWSMTQLWKSPPLNQIVRLQGTEVPQSCPGPLNVTDQLWGVNAHFSQLSRTRDGGKGIQRSTEVTTLTKYQEVFEILNCIIKEAGNTNSPNPHILFS